MSQPYFTNRALTDLDDIWLYIAQDSARAADRFLARILEKCRMLADAPLAGPARPELGAGLRSFPVGTFLIIYRPVKDGVEVLRVPSGYRDIEALFDS